MVNLFKIIEKICVVLIWIAAVISIFWGIVLPQTQVDPEGPEIAKLAVEVMKKLFFIALIIFSIYCAIHLILIPILE